MVVKIKLNRFWRFYIIFIVVGTILGVPIGWVLKKGIFKEKAIETKYCYYLQGDSLGKVYRVTNKNKGYQVIAYFYCNIDKKGIVEGDGIDGAFETIKKVKVLSYTEDSLLAKIRFVVHSDLRGGMVYDEECYVPAFTLHDTLPR